MNIEKIKNIVNNENPLISDSEKESQVLKELSNDEEILLHFLKILRYERDRKKECMFDMQTIISDIDIIHTWKAKNRWNWWMKHVLERIEPLFKNWKPIIWHQTKWNYDN